MKRAINFAQCSGALVFLLVGCGTIPKAGSQTYLEQPQYVPRPTLPPSTDPVVNAREAKLAAEDWCDAVSFSISNQALSLKKVAYNRKQAGLLITTVVGVAGSIVTAALASQIKANKTTGSVDTTPTTVVGATTAGATSIAGVVSLFAVGVGVDDSIARINDLASQIKAAETALDQTCQTLTAANASTCQDAATRLNHGCTSMAATLPYKVPGVDQADGALRTLQQQQQQQQQQPGS